MNGQLLAAGIGILLLFAGGAATLIALALRPPGLPELPPAPPPPAPRLRRPRLARRSSADRAQELRWIELGLAAGMTAPFLARALRGSPVYNLQRIRRVRARMQQTS